MKPRFSPSCDRSCVEMADRFASRRYSLKNKLGDRMIKQLLNSVIAKYRDLSVSRRSIICLSLRLRQIIDLISSDKSRYFGQRRPILANYYVQKAPEQYPADRKRPSRHTAGCRKLNE